MNIKLEKFEGPLSLLLKLIEREEMDITDISLARVAEDYVAYIREVENINPEEMADFLVVAAKLLLIKSKALLPYL
ncbi:chromosome segregation protein ScpA, partial [Candidatus Falkowbacteria bacterium]